MDRITFTRNIIDLLTIMVQEGENPIIDYVKRSDDEQMNLYMESKSKCDGIKSKSQHQFGKAMDIYFVEDGRLIDPKKGWEYWHKLWELKEGKPMISWDKGHFE